MILILPIYQRTVTPQGLEPRLIGPKPIVLPLDERVRRYVVRTGFEPV
jgi:hypothetical protein